MSDSMRKSRRVRRELPEHDPKGKNVGAPIELLPAQLLGRHVRHLALELARVRRREPPGGLGDAEVDDLRVALVRDEQVVRRHVAVDEPEQLPVLAAELVRRVQAFGRVGDDARGDPGGVIAAGRSSLMRVSSRSGSPCRYSIAIQYVVLSRPMSNTCATFGWLIPAAMRASSRNMSTS